MSDQNIFSGPPNWCKNAIATSQGWANSVTGEILVQTGGNFNNRPEYLAFFPVVVPGPVYVPGSLDFSSSLNTINYMLKLGV